MIRRITRSCSFSINLVSFRTFRRPLFPRPVSCMGLFGRFLQQGSSSEQLKYLHLSFETKLFCQSFHFEFFAPTFHAMASLYKSQELTKSASSIFQLFCWSIFLSFYLRDKKSGRLKLTKICFEAQLNVPISQLNIKFLNLTGTKIKKLNSWKHQHHCGQNDI